MTSDKEERRGRGRPKKWRRAEVLGQITEHYWREGVHALSLNEVCRRVSVSKPSIYRDFGGEDGLIEAVLGYYRDAVVTLVLDALKLELPFSEVMEVLIVGMTTPREHPPGCLFTEMRTLRSRLGPQSLVKLEEIEAERVIAFEQWYERALKRGEVTSSLSPAEASRYIDAQFTLLLIHMGMERPADEVRAEARLALSVLTL